MLSQIMDPGNPKALCIVLFLTYQSMILIKKRAAKLVLFVIYVTRIQVKILSMVKV